MFGWLPSLGQHATWSVIALLVYTITTRIDGVRRPPTSAIAWVMGLFLLPFVLLPLYLLFGRRKIKVPAATRTIHGKTSQHWPAALIESLGLAAPTPTDVRFHEDGEAARRALWDLLDGAEHTLDVSTFLIANDVLGREVVARLIRRARAGVRVRLLIDGAGAWLKRKPPLEALRAAGGEVALFRPLLALHRSSGRNLRNHRKFVIADDTRLWSGGRNLAVEYFCGDLQVAPWIDLSFDLRGTVATEAACQFEADWAVAKGSAPRRVDRERLNVHGSVAQFLPSGPDQPEDTAQALLVSGCFRAQRRVLAVTPYFVPDDSLLNALRLAALRGLQVTLVLPEVSNHRLADFVRGRALRVLAQAGGTIRVVPRMVHAKSVVVDDEFALCGSINLDARSLFINYESGVVFYGREQIEWLAQWIESLAGHGVPFAAKPPGFTRDLLEGLLLTVAFQL